MRDQVLWVGVIAFVALGCGASESGATRCGEQAGAARSEGTSGAESEAAVAPPPAEVRALADAPRRSSPPGTATIAFLARGLNAFVARLEMEAGAAVPEHQDATEEYIHVLEGGGTITIDGVTSEVAAGATVYMPANATVSFQNGDARLVAIQVFAGPEPAAKYDAWREVTEP
jgi:quercetin dioxygenase-like cupin family protein